jgi:hypothetical protein
VTLQASRHCPGELERNDEHDDQGDETAHGVHSTETTVSTKALFMPWGIPENTRFARCTGACGTDDEGSRHEWWHRADSGYPRYATHLMSRGLV